MASIVRCIVGGHACDLDLSKVVMVKQVPESRPRFHNGSLQIWVLELPQMFLELGDAAEITTFLTEWNAYAFAGGSAPALPTGLGTPAAASKPAS